MAYNPEKNEAILGGGDGCFGCRPVIGVVDLTKATFSEFAGIGFGFVNGIAVDSADNIAVSTTEDDANVEFYDLSTQQSFTVVLPNSGEQQIFSGADVEFDAVHKVFFVAQPVSSSSSGSSIYVYDTKGVLQGTLNGFSFSNASTVIPVHIALHPSTRTGFIDGPLVTRFRDFLIEECSKTRRKNKKNQIPNKPPVAWCLLWLFALRRLGSEIACYSRPTPSASATRLM